MIGAIKASRRGVLALFAAAPLGAKAAADAAIGEAAGINLTGLKKWGMTGRPSVGGGGAPIADTGPSGTDPYEAAAMVKKLTGLPEWSAAMLREQAWNVAALDPDIAAKRSWSMAVKILTQRERNYERLVEQIDEAATRSIGRRLFRQTFNTYWPF